MTKQTTNTILTLEQKAVAMLANKKVPSADVASMLQAVDGIFR
jgi:hypothetical protein